MSSVVTPPKNNGGGGGGGGKGEFPLFGFMLMMAAYNFMHFVARAAAS